MSPSFSLPTVYMHKNVKTKLGNRSHVFWRQETGQHKAAVIGRYNNVNLHAALRTRSPQYLINHTFHCNLSLSYTDRPIHLYQSLQADGSSNIAIYWTKCWWCLFHLFKRGNNADIILIDLFLYTWWELKLKDWLGKCYSVTEILTCFGKGKSAI